MVTRKDVAKLAGVSETTVTRVVTNRGYVSKESLDKVNEAVKELGYHPNMIARGLRTKKTYQIVFHADEMSNPFFAEMYDGIAAYTRQVGYHIIVNSHYTCNAVIQRQYDGVILPYDHQSFQEYKELSVPIVVVNFSKRDIDIPHVNVDIEVGLEEALDYLYSCGHRKIALATLDIVHNQRITTYARWHKKMGIPFQESLIFKEMTGKSNYEQGRNGAISMLERGLDFTAVLAFNDPVAIGMISAFGQRGLRVPEDISVIGYDDVTEAPFTNPPLTTIRAPLFDVGSECAKMLIGAMDGEVMPPKTFKTNLVIRSTVANLLKSEK